LKVAFKCIEILDISIVYSIQIYVILHHMSLLLSN